MAEFRTAEILNGARDRLVSLYWPRCSSHMVAPHIHRRPPLFVYYSQSREAKDNDIEDEVEHNDELEEEEEEEPMSPPPSTKKAAKKSSASASDATSAIDGDLSKGVQNLSVSSGVKKPYSFDTVDPTKVTKYCKKNTNYAEVNLFPGQVMGDDAVDVELIADGRKLRYQKSTPSLFGDTSWLKKSMGNAHHEDDSRVVAHDNATQVIRQNDKPKHKKNWGAPENAQVIDLPFQCRGDIKTKWDFFKSGEVVNGQTQYVSILTCRIEAADQRKERAKNSKVVVHDDDLSEDEDDSDFDEEPVDEGDGTNDGNDMNE